ncbi:hypothetical protein M422DRAFT_43584 [Sphaerobolus stellatus SS14]|nr:hypothetical protein M422DRAFT_43584 [Sphaerobolus stellatus SS14]
MIIQQWKDSPDGETKWGPLWSVASDGDTTRRKSFHLLLMENEVKLDDPLWDELGNLSLLNLQTGPDAVTMDFDFKHIFKRFATQICSPDGTLITDTIITQNHIAHELSRMEDISAKSIEALIDPADHQNVPEAVRLLQRISEIGSLLTTELSPGELKLWKAITFLSTLLSAVISSFINPKLSLSEQLLSLALFKHGTAFIYGQLYHDLQSMIKNAFLCIAKL